jgi:hypothetical protein
VFGNSAVISQLYAVLKKPAREQHSGATQNPNPTLTHMDAVDLEAEMIAVGGADGSERETFLTAIFIVCTSQVRT